MRGCLRPILAQPRSARHAPRLPVSAKASRRGAWLLHWYPGERKTVYVCALVLGLAALVLIAFAQKIWDDYIGQAPGHPPRFGDFLALWSYAKIAAVHPAADLYDLASLHIRQVELGMNPSAQNPFPYPPIFILLVWPLNLLPYDASYLAWMGETMAIFIWAVAATCCRLPLCMLGILVAPAGVATIAAGQSGFLAAALIVAGLRLAGSRPIFGGILIGILTYKPQLGLLVPIALAAGRFWTAFSVACATSVALAGIVTLAFGWAIWPAWLSMMPAYVAMFDRAMVGEKFMPTIIVDLQMAGLSLHTAKFMQALVATAVCILVWRCFRRGSGQLATAALLVGTFLATPHAFIYDLPMIAAALALVIQERTEAEASFGLGEILILILAFLFPAIMMLKGLDVPIGTGCLALFFGLILRRESQIARERHLLNQISSLTVDGSDVDLCSEAPFRRLV